MQTLDGVLTPELALVDPLAAERARRELPEIVLYEDTLAERRNARPRTTAAEEPRPPQRPLVRTPLVVALLLTALLAAGSAALALRPAAPARTHRTLARPVLVRTAAAVRPAPAARTIPDFVWSSVRGAAAYRVEFARGRHVVFVTTATRPRLHVAASTLAPGRYRWRVWPLDRAGARTGPAVVDATLNVG